MRKIILIQKIAGNQNRKNRTKSLDRRKPIIQSNFKRQSNFPQPKVVTDNRSKQNFGSRNLGTTETYIKQEGKITIS